jgi:hypothetical protein
VSYLSEPEEWRQIPGLEGYYDASTHGRIKRASTGRIRKPYPTGPYKRMMVLLSIDGHHQNRYVGELVARTWIGPRPPGQLVRHGPAGQADNNPGNLCYGTYKQNTWDRKRDNTWMTGEQNGRATLTWKQVREIRRRYRDGERQHVLASEFGVVRSVIGGICRNEIWVDDQYQNPRIGKTGPSRKRDGHARLTQAIAEEIRERYRAGARQVDLAALFGVTQPCISQIVLGKTWTGQAAAGSSPP